MGAILKGISEKGSRVFNYLSAGVERGLSGSQILGMLRDLDQSTYDGLLDPKPGFIAWQREEGLSYRMTDFYSDMRLIRGQVLQEDALKYVPLAKTPSIRFYGETVVPLRVGNYQTIFRATGTDLETGETQVRFCTIAHDVLRPREELEELATTTIMGTSPEFEIDDIMPTRARRSPGMGV